jgi:molybdopterin molybdotransferase
MLSVDQALQLVLQHAQPIAPRIVKPFERFRGVLAEAVVSDIDSPPHDKSVVDGYAVQAASCAASGAVLQVLEEVTAGAMPAKAVTIGTATRIMTGAPIPAGADAVVMVEQTVQVGPDQVRVNATEVRLGQNITRRAASLARGQIVLPAGTRLRAIELGLLAEVGATQISVIQYPSIKIISTGNELVEFTEMPGPGQIRNSNSLLLWGLAVQAGAAPLGGRIARDDADDLRARIRPALECDVLLLSGGVSMGVLDLVPQVLTELGVDQVFHKVNLKPGKPLWFGVKRHADREQPTLVFGLPGNPVSSLVCFELFVRPAIQKLSGLEPTGLARSTAVLTKDHQQRGERPTYWPARFLGEVDVCNFSHELRTPLNSIIGFGEVLENAATLTEKQRQYAGSIRRSGGNLLDMINDILALAKTNALNKPPEDSYEGGPCSIVTPLPWKGSGDLATLAGANCLAYFPAGDRLFKAGETVEVLHLPS